VKPGVRRQYLLVGIAGGIGTLCRYAVGEWPHFPRPFLATLFINLSGSFLIGYLQALSEPESRFYLGPNARLILMTGFCGGYTTFSTFSLLSFYSMQRALWSDAFLNIVTSHLLGLTAVFAGYFASSAVVRMMEIWARRWQYRRKRL
jgi:Integral membrane protein possibly involved in chromosome condensation